MKESTDIDVNPKKEMCKNPSQTMDTLRGVIPYLHSKLYLKLYLVCLNHSHLFPYYKKIRAERTIAVSTQQFCRSINRERIEICLEPLNHVDIPKELNPNHIFYGRHVGNPNKYQKVKVHQNQPNKDALK